MSQTVMLEPRSVPGPARSAASPEAPGRHSPDALGEILDALTLGVLTFDRVLEIDFHNAALGTILDIRPPVLARCTGVLQLFEASPLLDEDTVRQAHEACRAAVASSNAEHRVVVVAPAGRRRALELHIRRIGVGRLLATVEDVTARQADEARAREDALRDPLTGLPNRQAVAERIAAVIASQSNAPQSRARAPSTPQTSGLEGGAAVTDPLVPGPLAANAPAADAPAVLMVDLDHFKSVNDTLGHPVGDALLRLVAQRLRSVLREHDVVARLGGDEFAILLAPIDRPSLSRLARRIVDVLGRPYLVEGHLVTVGASVGIARAPADGGDSDTLLRHAGLALYHVKSTGRNAFSFFEPAMDTRAHARRTLEFELRRALTMREFELHYQPQVNLDTGAVSGCEALLRWRHPERGLVPPDEFIPLAEEIGLIVPLGEWALHQACRDAATWPDNISVAVNVSPRQFENGKLADSVAKALAASGLPGHRLEVEITESVLIRNEAVVLTMLRRVRALGVRVAMDDFGTGYSSLSQLRCFPFDKIKIDRAFVAGATDGGHDPLIRAITAMGASLGMATIAEGVETQAQLARIRAEGCAAVQGYLFSRPVPAADVASALATLAARPPASPGRPRA